MTLTPDPWERTARILSDLRLGLPVRLTGGAVPMLMAAAETLSAARLRAMRALGPAHLAITARRANVLNAMVYDGDLTRIVVPGDADHQWLGAMADPSLDLRHPMKGPFQAVRGGDAALERAALRLCKQARLLPAALLVPDREEGQSGLLDYDITEPAPVDAALHHITAARVPLAAARDTRVHVFTHGADFAEHYAVEIGAPSRDAPVLCRLHSACLTGDILGSLKCDCGAQLNAALDHIAAAGSGVLLYLNQEGRGIGLANKLRAYALQDQGFDTVEANHRLGFEDDERDLAIGAQILKQMGFGATRLMTNNPAKVARMEDAGLRVTERVPHRYGQTDENARYLATKAAKSGHLL